ncbi:hypothetical protein [Gemmobacter caeruleus]|uniref:hypothetical protein n=1 Tax=Gemmobacter caeruleus TaxID=2595004 RepID=UPI0011EE5128|nr:hypothetical protein [Gemmobacter caeruleus]
MKTLRLLALSAALAAPLAPMAHAEMTPVESVKVEADLTAVQNERAATYWAGIAEDLQAAILARVQDRIADKGSRISVDINEVALANSFETKTGLADSVLVGNVNISSDDNTKFDSYELAVSVELANKYLPPGTVALTSMSDSPEHYQAMIHAFAENVVERLK